jgi:hypothetical protein
MKERRTLERFKLRLPAKIEIPPESPGAERMVLKLLTANVCSGGAFFPTTNPLLQGTAVRVSLFLDNVNLKLAVPSWTLVEVLGTVLRSEPSGMAIDFEPDHKIIPKTRKEASFPFPTT